MVDLILNRIIIKTNYLKGKNKPIHEDKKLIK
jgi:hypothetical protein